MAEETHELVGEEVPEEQSGQGVSRRQLVAGAAGLVVGAAAGAGIAIAAEERKFDRAESDEAPGAKNYNRIDLNMTSPSFYDQDHPMGIAEPIQQRYVTFCMFNMNSGTTREKLQILLATWTAIAAQLMQGSMEGSSAIRATDVRPDFKNDSVPRDTGECYDLYPANLSITFGFGPTLFDDRFGIESFKPELLVEMPRCTGDRFEPETAGSDFGVQICADDPQVIQHAVRALARAAYNTATLTYTHNGFMPLRQSGEQSTPRDLFGFRDGTTNPVEDDEFDKDVWIIDGDQQWCEGSSYLTYRNCHILIEPWDNKRISDQERLVGRVKDTGAPLSSPDGEEFDPVDLEARGEDGELLIDPNSHVAITSDQRLGFKVFRRDYAYWNGLNDAGMQDAGFVHLTYVNDPMHFWQLRDDMGKYDQLNEYYYDTHSGTYVVPQSPRSGRYIGQEFFEE